MKTLATFILVVASVQTAWMGFSYAQNPRTPLAGPSKTLTPEEQKTLKALEDAILNLENKAARLEVKEEGQITKTSDKMVKRGPTAFWNRWRAKAVSKRLNRTRGRLFSVTKKRDDALVKELLALKEDLRVMEGLMAQIQMAPQEGAPQTSTPPGASQANGGPSLLSQNARQISHVAFQALRGDIELATKRIEEVTAILLRQ